MIPDPAADAEGRALVAAILARKAAHMTPLPDLHLPPRTWTPPTETGTER